MIIQRELFVVYRESCVLYVERVVCCEYVELCDVCRVVGCEFVELCVVWMYRVVLCEYVVLCDVSM